MIIDGWRGNEFDEWGGGKEQTAEDHKQNLEEHQRSVSADYMSG